MKLLSLEMEGFRAFRDPASVVLDRGHSLTIVRGENKHEPKLGSNGAAKSTIADALCWVLYGKTARRLSAGTVETWGSKGATRVVLKLEQGGVERTLVRTRRPITLLLDGVEVTQDTIDDLLGLDYETFMQTVVHGQYGVLFPDMRPMERLDLFTKILDLEKWVKAADRAKARANKAAEDRIALERRRERLQGRLEAQEASLEGVVSDTITGHLEQRQARAEEISVKIRKLRKKAKRMRAGIQAVEDDTAELKDLAEEARQEVAEAEESYSDLLRGLSDHKSAIDGLLGAVSELEALSPECPICGAESDPVVIAKESRRLQKEVEGHKTSLSKLEDEAQEYLRTELEPALEREDKISKKLRKQQERLITLDKEMSAVLEKTAHRATSLKEVQHSIEVYTKELEAIEERRETIRQEIEVVKSEARSLNRKIKELEIEEDRAKFWMSGFKELRLWLIEKALLQLTIQANSALVALGLQDWAIDFFVEHTTKSGTLSRGFSVIITNHSRGATGVPWEAWSGGESQRLRIACAVGLSDIVRTTQPGIPPLEIWDEPTEHLTQSGVSDLIRFFSERSKSEGLSTLLIDHRSLEMGDFDHTVTVTKTERTSEIRDTL